jgi:hypothetical protein
VSARLDRRRLALVAARFASPHDGERLAALEAAGRILAAGGLSWRELIDGAAEAHDDQGEPVAAPPHHEIATALARSGDGVLTAWELRFLRGLLTFRTLSPKQRAMLDGIKAKLEASAWCDA